MEKSWSLLRSKEPKIRRKDVNHRTAEPLTSWRQAVTQARAEGFRTEKGSQHTALQPTHVHMRACVCACVDGSGLTLSSCGWFTC